MEQFSPERVQYQKVRFAKIEAIAGKEFADSLRLLLEADELDGGDPRAFSRAGRPAPHDTA
jgi:hypothetical protein